MIGFIAKPSGANFSMFSGMVVVAAVKDLLVESRVPHIGPLGPMIIENIHLES